MQAGNIEWKWAKSRFSLTKKEPISLSLSLSLSPSHHHFPIRKIQTFFCANILILLRTTSIPLTILEFWNLNYWDVMLMANRNRCERYLSSEAFISRIASSYWSIHTQKTLSLYFLFLLCWFCVEKGGSDQIDQIDQIRSDHFPIAGNISIFIHSIPIFLSGLLSLSVTTYHQASLGQEP